MMVIPKEHLDTVDYYDVKYANTGSFGICIKQTIITLHYKKWYKLRKKFVFRWPHIGDGYYQEPETAIILQQQLIKHFG